MTGAWLVAIAFPVGDWQFWAVTIIAALALGWLLRGVLRAGLDRLRGRRGVRQRRATLTVKGRPLEK